MESYQLEGEAYVKFLLHAAKYPSSPLFGLLIGTPYNQVYKITDAFPLSHQHLTRPLLEMSLVLVQEMISKKDNDVSIIGIYYANENDAFLEMPNSVRQIATKVEQYCTRGCILSLSRDSLKTGNEMGIDLYLKDVKRGWMQIPNRLELTNNSDKIVLNKALAQGAQYEIYDMEDHLQDMKKDWTNPNAYSILNLNV